MDHRTEKSLVQIQPPQPLIQNRPCEECAGTVREPLATARNPVQPRFGEKSDFPCTWLRLVAGGCSRI
jgi:hypothetical protein